MDARPLPRGAATSAPHRVVIIGGGFAGLYAAKNLGKAGDLVDITLIDRRNHHLFQPMLYQVATGALSPGEIAQPLRSIFRMQRNTTVLLGEAIDIDAVKREVRLSDGGPVPYDTLIVATGAHHAYFGHEDWAPYAPGLKTIDDATEIRRRILIAFEAAEREADPVERAAWMTFVLIGGGPTGVELAGALGEIANDTLRNDFRSINPQDARIVLVEAMDRVLATFPPGRSASARRQLEKLGVVVRTKTKVVDVEDGLVRVETPTGETEEIHAHTVLWAAGVLASSFGRKVAAATGAETDRNGRVRVGPDLTVPGHPEVFVVGDAAVQPWKRDRAVPGVAQGGIQGGSYAAKAVLARLRGQPIKPFRYSNHGDVAVIGRLRGVTDIPWMGLFGQQGGFTAWLLWLLIHITYLIGFSNRIVVVTRWAFSFLTRGRSTRLITGEPLVPRIEEPAPIEHGQQPAEPGTVANKRRSNASGAASQPDGDAPAADEREREAGRV